MFYLCSLQGLFHVLRAHDTATDSAVAAIRATTHATRLPTASAGKSAHSAPTHTTTRPAEAASMPFDLPPSYVGLVCGAHVQRLSNMHGTAHITATAALPSTVALIG